MSKSAAMCTYLRVVQSERSNKLRQKLGLLNSLLSSQSASTPTIPSARDQNPVHHHDNKNKPIKKLNNTPVKQYTAPAVINDTYPCW